MKALMCYSVFNINKFNTNMYEHIISSTCFIFKSVKQVISIFKQSHLYMYSLIPVGPSQGSITPTKHKCSRNDTMKCMYCHNFLTIQFTCIVLIRVTYIYKYMHKSFSYFQYKMERNKWYFKLSKTINCYCDIVLSITYKIAFVVIMQG